MSGLIPPHDDIKWYDMPDGLHQKGVRVTKPDEGHIRAEMLIRRKPQFPVMEDPHATTFTNLDYLRTFGHDD